MTPQNRNRIIWLLAALVGAYAIASLLAFAATGGFSNVMLIVSLVVYGTVTAAALTLLASAPRRHYRRLRLLPSKDEAPPADEATARRVPIMTGAATPAPPTPADEARATDLPGKARP